MRNGSHLDMAGYQWLLRKLVILISTLYDEIIAPAGFGPEAKIRGGIIVCPTYTYKECVKYCCSM